MKYELERVSVRLVKDSPVLSDRKIKSPADAIAVLQGVLQELDRELMCIINLKTDGTPINCNFVTSGTINQTIAHPREILKTAILSNAASMIMMHNHLGDNVYPSRDDIEMTGRMVNLSELVGIPLLDHVIVSAVTDRIYSFLEQDTLPGPVHINYSRFDMERTARKVMQENNLIYGEPELER